jgi:hypothetical protein
VKDILEVLRESNFPNHKQVETLEVVNYALYKKKYPQDTCGIIDRKINLLKQAEQEKSGTICPTCPQGPSTLPCGASEVASTKVRSVVILEILKQLQLGIAHNDLTKICKLISFLTGNSYNSIYNEMQKGIYFSKFHGKQIDEANRILAELNASISIDKDKQY